MKPDHGKRAKRDEDREHDSLGNDKRRLRLGRRQLLQERQLLERLNHAHEDIKVKRDSRRDDVDPTPGASEMEGIERGDGGGQ